MPKPDWLNAFEEAANDILEEAKVPGAAYAIMREGKLEAEGGFGYRNVEEKLPATPDTLFGIGSCTKSFTALAIMQLDDEGALSVDDPVVTWLPEFQVPNPDYRHAITIHHFLTHTSGMPPLPTLFYAMANSLRDDASTRDFPLAVDLDEIWPIETYGEVLELLSQLDYELLGAPGEYLSYCNDGYGLLGAIIERASGVDYRTYIRERLLEPMGLRQTLFDPAMSTTPVELSELYARHMDDGEAVVYHAPGRWEFPPLEAAGYLASTARDMARYLEIYRNHGLVGNTRIVSEENIAKMFIPHADVVTRPGTYYGYGLMIQPGYNGMTVIEHGGGIKGVDAQFMYVPEKELSLAVLANVAGDVSARVARTLLNAATGLDLDQKRWDYPEYTPGDAVDLERFTGSFASGEGATVEFFVEDGELKATMEEQTAPARLTSDDAVLVAAGEGYPVRFLFDDEGKAWGIAAGLRILRKAE